MKHMITVDYITNFKIAIDCTNKCMAEISDGWSIHNSLIQNP